MKIRLVLEEIRKKIKKTKLHKMKFGLTLKK